MSSPTPMEIALQVTTVLEQLEVPYLIGGSLASILHGMVRTTLDADIVAQLEPGHVAPLVQALSPEFYVSEEAIQGALQHRSSFNVIHQPTMFKVDIFVARARPFEQSRFARRIERVVAAPDHSAWISSAEDLILAKLEWYQLGNEVSERQWRDVLGVIKLQGDQLDVAYLRRWAAALRVTNLLERALEASQS